MSTPKLAMIPSGYRSGTLYSVLPNNGDGDFTFTRGSSATRVNKDGLIEVVGNDVPRLDYSNGNCPSLLLEPSRTNIILYSEQFDNAVWSKSALSVTANEVVSPSGILNADKITENASNATHKIQRTFTAPNNTYVFSVFLKNGGRSTVHIGMSDGSSGQANALVDLENGTILNGLIPSGSWSDIDFNIVSYGNGWYYVWIKGTSNAGSAITPNIEFYNDNRTYLGDGVSGIYIWGAQLEEGSYATSYIPTAGSAVTRIADKCINAGNVDLFDITEGTLFLDSIPYKATGPSSEIYIHDGTNNNRIVYQFQSNNTDVRFIVVSGGSFQVDRTENFIVNTRNKIAFTFKNNEFKIYINGILRNTDTSGSVPSGMNKFSFSNIISTNFFDGKVYDARIYDTVLTEAEAIQLTTL